MTAELSTRVNILVIEDNPGDARLIKETLVSDKLINKVFFVKDGVEAMDFLYKKGEFEKTPLPDLILLDLNLPRKNGIEVLREIKSDKALMKIPVVIMTTSQSVDDILKTYELHANCFITKPIDLNQFIKVVKSVEDFWFSIVKLPPKQ